MSSRSRSRQAKEQCRDRSGQFTECDDGPSRSSSRRSRSRSSRSRSRSSSRRSTGASLSRAEKQVAKQFRLGVAEAQQLTAANAVRPILLRQEAELFKRQAQVLEQQADQVQTYNAAQQRLLEEARVRRQEAEAKAAEALRAAGLPVPGAVAAPVAGANVFINGVPYTVVGPAPQAGKFIVRGPFGASLEAIVSGDQIDVGPGVLGGGLIGAAGINPLAGLALAPGAINPLAAASLAPGFGINPSVAALLGANLGGGRRRSLTTAQARELARIELLSNPYKQADVLARPCWDPEYDDCPELLATQAGLNPYFV